MHHGLRFALLLLSSLMLFALSAQRAGAEIEPEPWRSWGVSGLATGTTTDAVKSQVWAIEQVGNRIFVGGKFLKVNSQNNASQVDQPFLAAFDATTGDYLSNWMPDLNGAVYALQASPDGSRLFVGGEFTSVNGSPVEALVALDPFTGQTQGNWVPSVARPNAACCKAVVRGLDVAGSSLYVAGNFTHVRYGQGNELRVYRAAKLALSNAAPDPAFTPVLAGSGAWGIDVSPNADRVYFVGYFSSVNGQPGTGNFAAVRPWDGSLVPGMTAYVPNKPTSPYLQDVESYGDRVYLGGSQHILYVLDAADLSVITTHSTDFGGDFQDLEIVGNRLYASCHCHTRHFENWDWHASPNNIPAAITTNSDLVHAYDAATGNHLRSFAPDLSATGAGIWAIHGSPDGCLWTGGDLTRAGVAGTSSRTVRGFVKLCDQSTAPYGLNSTFSGTDRVTIAWPTVAGVNSYNVYRDGVWIASDDNGFYVDTGLQPGTAYTYNVSAVNNGVESAWSNQVQASTTGNGGADTERPTVPTNVVVTTTTNSSVTLTWSPATDNVGVNGYSIFRSPTPGATPIFHTWVPTVTTYTDTGLTASTSYTYYLKATDTAGNNSFRTGNRDATTINGGGGADTERPSIPTNVVVTTTTNSSVTLTWSPATDNVGVNGYSIFRSPTPGATPIFHTWVPTVTTYTDTGLTANTTYTYYLKATDTAGNNSFRTGNRDATTINGGGGADTERPSIPTNVVVTTTTNSSVTLTWNPATDNVGVNGYSIFRSPTPGATPIFHTWVPTVTTYTDTGLTANTTYTYYLKATDTAGNNSFRTGNRDATTINGGGGADTERPSIPTNVVVTTTTNSSVTLTWNPATDNVGVNGYSIFRSPTPGATPIFHTWVPTVTTYTDTGLTANTTYTYYLKATDTAGNNSFRTGNRDAVTQ